MNNLGKAKVLVEILNGLYGIDKEATKYNFDVTAYQWNTMQNSPYFPPFLADQITDPQDGFAAIFPTKRIKYMDNYIKYADTGTAVKTAPTQPYIAWIPTEAKEGILSDIFSPTVSDTLPVPFNNYTLIQPQNNLEYPSDYIGPQWRDARRPRLAPTNDVQTIQNWLRELGSTSAAGTWVTTEEQDDLKGRSWINQHEARDGLWWGVESNAFLKSNMPFWVNMKIFRTPSTANHETKFIISLGIDDDTQAFDIVLGQNNKPYVIDYYNGRGNPSGSSAPPTTTGPSFIQKEFDQDLSRVLDTQEEIEIGIMTIAGRLIIWINKVELIYTRIEKSDGDSNGTIKECKIGAGKIRIYGTNVQAMINVSPMIFAPLAALALPLPSVINNTGTSPVDIKYQGVKNDGTLSGSVAILPQQPDKSGTLYGVDSDLFFDSNGNIRPFGVGFHQQGGIFFIKAGSVSITSLSDTSFYILLFRTEDVIFDTPSGIKFIIEHAGCPYFFRIKGGFELLPKYQPPTSMLVPEVISVSETASAPDYFHALTNASVTIYNKDGKYDFLRDKQYGIRISWGWMSNIKKTFTGVIVSTSTSEIAGKETMTLQCEDYMFILKNTPIVNSPFYDGMVAKNVIEDLAKRGGISRFADEFESPDDYFLPSGYTFSKPVMRFPSKNMLFQCMMDITKRFEAFVYFDAEGQLVLHRLPGGLFSVTAGSFVAEFYRDPNKEDPSKIILNEKNVEYNFSSTANKINIYTVDRDTRNAILYTTSAGSSDNPSDHLQYRKVILLDQPAYGDLEVARKYAHELAKRVFYPIRKTSFSTVGASDASINKVLDFIKIDGMEYRLMSIARKYSADSNDFTNEYGAEWVGGA